MLIGRKAISKALNMSWRTIRNWQRKFGLPILRTPTGKPMITRELYRLWLIKGQDKEMQIKIKELKKS